MTTIDIDTSPLQAAREWRGIGLVVAARNAGLPVAQAEALESGMPNAFDTIDEMIAAAVVYGASIGIGRDEAMALLDRTVCRTGADVALPDVADEDGAGTRIPAGRFTSDVRSKSARMAHRADVDVVELPAFLDDDFDLDSHSALSPIVADPIDVVEDSTTADEPAAVTGPTPQQAVDASGELHLDAAFGPEAPWERASGGSELEAWAAEDSDDGWDRDGSMALARTGTLGKRFRSGTFAAVERVVGTERAEVASTWLTRNTQRAAEATAVGRERLRRSEHATLIVAIAAGAVLVALLVAIGGALESDEPAASSKPVAAPSQGPVLSEPGEGAGLDAQADAKAAALAKAEADAPAAAAAGAAAPTPAATTKAVPQLAPTQMTVDVLNAGSQKGKAKTVADTIRAGSYRIGEVTNAKGTYSGPTVIFPKGRAREGRLLARRAGITSVQQAPGSSRRFIVVVS